MAQNNKKKIMNFDDAKKAANELVNQSSEQLQVQKSVFESLMNELESISPEMGGFTELAALLSLDDVNFSLIAPIFLDELEKAINRVEDKLILVQAMNLKGAKLEDIRVSYLQIENQIDTEFAGILSNQKKDFLKRLLALTYNAIAEADGVAKRIIQIPIELTSEDAKIPTYANLGDGAVDLYSPADYTINPGETIIIPCDVKVALPYGYAFLIHPRSGTSAKTKLRVANSVGLVDSQYKGVIGVIIENIEPAIKDVTYEFDENGKPVITSVLHGQSYTISKGERFAQMRLVEVPTASFFQVESVAGIGDDRGGGFGSSGTN